MTSEPTVSVVMTTRAEPLARVERALASVAAQDYAGDIEVIVAMPVGDQAPYSARVVDNPSGARCAGLNRAVAVATGEVVVRLDARSSFPVDYLRRCVQRLQSDATVGVVGGVQLARAGSRTTLAAGIARALRNPWATGGAAYRRVGGGGAADTVYLGVFRRAELLSVDGWDEQLDANEDFDLCQRYQRAGFTVWLEPQLAVAYEARATLRDVWSQYLAFGRSKTRYWRLRGERPSKRQLAPLVVAPLFAAVALWKPLTIVAAAVGLVAVDHAADPGERDARVRLVSLVAYVPIIGGWVSGVVAEALRRD